ncbi:BadF/BadG/BcrA/BcrD ATPase family protein [Micromonospora sp. NPDC050397]|uniref:N-acetylglucosamine kinase n=1 Tax=Micromonospora sp. NPDC050397 TaxID=3364279 RepID=UPI00384A7E44
MNSTRDHQPGGNVPPPPDPLVIGLDVGGSSTRAVVVSLTGEQLGAGTADGGNPTSHGAEPAAERVRTALHTALGDLDPTRVRAGAIGLAGAGRWHHDPNTRAAYDRAWHDAGLRCRYDVHGDALVGYACATPTPDGTVLIAGTGAIAAQVRQLRLHRVADGHGWLLGDAGSGFWLGREAVRHTLAALDAHPAPADGVRPGPLDPPRAQLDPAQAQHDPAQAQLDPAQAQLDPAQAQHDPAQAQHDPARARPSPLSALVLTELLGSAELTGPPRQLVGELIRAATVRPPVALARLAPLVFRAARDGDPAARALVDSAAEQLVASVTRVRPAGDSTPIVLGGGLLSAPTPTAPPGPPPPGAAPIGAASSGVASPDAASPDAASPDAASIGAAPIGGEGPLTRAVATSLARQWPQAPLLIAGDGAVGAAWLAARTLPEVTDPVELHRWLRHY